ncbi:helix-turn-helix domain-containing protein [Sinorhizobium meliloti]|uniref:helix-turn-helix domain-containing protein n=1 Tax=Rhizobium meliloti TaxID=382 RepID=UPI0004298A4A|nr:helix-turn-helix domain-containing protein [Sinorhizobium meliloti]MDE3830273.1 winged helix-turn-helix domain-containing protein [Sinorhizobium meliloti]MDE4578364.1 helix-turn-helix domain-containing protein [Sinorhizobium meliloti]MDW9473401.1 hypothetical protein [Sinorhizobium meliloti]RVP23623.1 winged helix family transcriptional regulator [Sinorhizobium meliloti]
MDRIVLDLQREITILRERVRQLEELLAPTTVPVPIEFGLTSSDVFVCKMRKKLARFGVTIETVWGQGYRLLNRHEFCSGKAA